MSHVVRIPHLSLPIRLASDGSFAVEEQDTAEEITQGVQVLMLTREGERLELPAFGVANMVFAVDIDTHAIAEEASVWDPRASVLVTDDTDPFDDLIRTVRAHVQGGS